MAQVDKHWTYKVDDESLAVVKRPDNGPALGTPVHYVRGGRTVEMFRVTEVFPQQRVVILDRDDDRS